MSRKFSAWFIALALVVGLGSMPAAQAWLPSDPPPGPQIPPPIPDPGPQPQPQPPPPVPPPPYCHDMPEPSTLLLGLFAAGALGLRLMRRGRQD